MATLTVTSRDYIRPHRGRARLRTFPEDASQTFKKGDPLIFGNTAGNENRVKIAGADPTAIIGFAAQDASGVTGADVSVWLAKGEAEFVGRVQDSGALDQTQIAAAGYGLVADGTNSIWRVDVSDTTNVNVHITQLIDADADVNGRVAFFVLAAARLVYLS